MIPVPEVGWAEKPSAFVNDDGDHAGLVSPAYAFQPSLRLSAKPTHCFCDVMVAVRAEKHPRNFPMSEVGWAEKPSTFVNDDSDDAGLFSPAYVFQASLCL
jgi:hypothetical protein